MTGSGVGTGTTWGTGTGGVTARATGLGSGGNGLGLAGSGGFGGSSVTAGVATLMVMGTVLSGTCVGRMASHANNAKTKATSMAIADPNANHGLERVRVTMSAGKLCQATALI